LHIFVILYCCVLIDLMLRVEVVRRLNLFEFK
jgi:hypothetical protein